MMTSALPGCRRRVCCVSMISGLLMILMLAEAGWAKAPPEALAVGIQGDSHMPSEVPHISGDISIDGNIEEAAWAKALTMELRFETRPGENIAPPVETLAYLTYSDSHLYIAFHALDPDPKAIRAHLSDRDDAFSDDFVGIVLDTFNDERRAWEFFVNPLGVQMDMFLDDVGGGEDSSWDAIWDSAGRITEEGYQVEMAIPFHQLRFPGGEGRQTWGIDALRFYPRNQRHRISLHPLDRAIDCYLCQATKVAGFEGATPGRNIELVPTLTSSRVDEAEELGDPLEEGDPDAEFGITAKWGITPNLILNGTINPDFSQIEADVAQLDVNNQFALFFPETRPFFLEGADFFDTPMNAVFTRNIADPEWGAKLTGKVQRNGIGTFGAEDAQTNLLFPGSQSSDSDQFEFPTTTGVMRYRRDVGENSSLGALVTSRAGNGSGSDYKNIVAGIDGNLRFTDADSVRFQFLGSQTQYPDDIVEEYEQPTDSFDDTSWQINYNHNSRNWEGYAQYRSVGENFRADMGFMPRVDYTFALAGLNHIWWGEEGDFYTRIGLGSDYDLTEDQSGQLLEEEFEIRAWMGGPKQSFAWVDVGQRERYYEGVYFDETFYQTFLEFEPTGNFFFGLFLYYGDQIDFDNVRPGTQTVIEPQFRLNIGRHLKFRVTHENRTLDVEGGQQLFEANLSQARVVYQFNRRTFLRLITQYTDVTRDPSLYEDVVNASDTTLFHQLLFSYTVNPQTVLFLGYSETQDSENDASLIDTDRAIFLKIGYAFVL